ncbi:MAG: phosphodiesterase [Acidobacteria bacterium]|nr:phosphodiesterase [Acidobacteriota bacterium]
MAAPCLFASDLHGHRDRYDTLLAAVEAGRPDAVFLGGDLLPHAFEPLAAGGGDDEAGEGGFLDGYLARRLSALRERLGASYPAIFAILGNDDPRAEEAAALDLDARGLWRYAHGRRLEWNGFSVYGYACVPPTPFLLKDWERYDVSRYVDPGCVSPEEGWRSLPVDEREARYRTIAEDLEALAGAGDMDRAIFLFHCPPYGGPLDRAALDGRWVDHVPLDVHVGSIAIQRFILRRSPLATLHGHVHESARLTGAWRAEMGRTRAFSAAHDGPELALVSFDPERLDEAARVLL